MISKYHFKNNNSSQKQEKSCIETSSTFLVHKNCLKKSTACAICLGVRNKEQWLINAFRFFVVAIFSILFITKAIAEEKTYSKSQHNEIWSARAEKILSAQSDMTDEDPHKDFDNVDLEEDSLDSYSQSNHIIDVNDIIFEYENVMNLLKSDIEDYIEDAEEACEDFNDSKNAYDANVRQYSKKRLNAVINALDDNMTQLDENLSCIINILKMRHSKPQIKKS